MKSCLTPADGMRGGSAPIAGEPMWTSLIERRMEESMAGQRQKKSKTKVAFIDARDLPETSKSKQEQRKGANSEKLEILLPKNDKTLKDGIRLPTMEDLYFQRNDKTLKEVPMQHCQATALRKKDEIVSYGWKHAELASARYANKT